MWGSLEEISCRKQIVIYFWPCEPHSTSYTFSEPEPLYRYTKWLECVHVPVCASSWHKEIKRLRSRYSCWVSLYKVCCGTQRSDFRYQMLRVPNAHLDAVLFTHPSSRWLPGLMIHGCIIFLSRKAMDVYANALTEEAIKRGICLCTLLIRNIPAFLEINPDDNLIDETPFNIGDVPVTSIQAWHYKMPVYGYRFGKFYLYYRCKTRLTKCRKKRSGGSEILVVTTALRKPGSYRILRFSRPSILWKSWKFQRRVVTQC